MTMFRSARLRLTLWYLVIIMAISISFSAVVFRVLDNEIYRFARIQRFRIDRGVPAVAGVPSNNVRFESPMQILPEFDEELVRDTEQRLLMVLVLVNAGIALTSGLLGYVLAGRTLGPIQKMVDEQRRFVSDASHELKTPLTILRTTLEVYLRGKKKTLLESEELVKESLEEIKRLQVITEAMLRLAAYQNDHHIELAPVAIEPIIEDSLRQVKMLAKEKHIEVSCVFFPESEKAVQVLGNQEGLVHLLLILLENAVKYSAPKGSIELQIHCKEKSVTLHVIDNGIGINGKDVSKIFDRFYRADVARSSQKQGGYGLGLSIAQDIATAHHTRIAVESEQGKGSKFSFTLPRVQLG